MFYDKANCDGCGIPLHDGEDVVVCPVCGTPQHRACYEKENKCVNEQLHESGFVWENPNKPEPEVQEPARVQETPESSPELGPPVGMPMPALDVNPIFYERAGIDPEAEFDGIRAREAVSYTQVSAKRYVRKFSRTDGKKNFISWNWGAFFLSPAWFFYRKLYKVGFVFLGLIVAVNLFLFPQNKKIADNYEPMQTAYTEYAEAVTAVTENQTPENEAIVAEKEAIVRKTLDELMPAVLAISLGTFIVPNTVAALIADSIYKKKMLADIKFAHKSTKDQNVIKYALLRRGGVALLPALAALMIESYLPNLILQIVNYFILK